MYALSNLETNTSLHSLNESILENKKIKKIRKTLLNLEKEEISSFCPLKVKIYKEEKKEDQKDEIIVKIPATFKSYFEDYKKYRGVINQVESGNIPPSHDVESTQFEQIDSSDLVDSE